MLTDQYLGINEDVYLAAARWQYGPSATLWPNPGHAYQWNARIPNNMTRLPINLQGYSDANFSQNWRVVMAEGVDKYAWRWFNTYNPDPGKSVEWKVLPVVFVTRDQIWNISEVGAAASRWAHNLQAVSAWYLAKLGKAFKVCRPQIIPDSKDMLGLRSHYEASKTTEGMTPEQYQKARYLPWDTAVSDYKAHMAQRVNTNVIYAMTHFAGLAADWDFAAAGGGPWLYVSSFATVHTLTDLLTVSNPRLQTLGYAIAHEIGHCFGLGHTDSQLAGNWQQSIMQAAKPPHAVLCDYEKQRLLNNPFFA